MKKPRVLSFYTFKGNAGCSAALANVACRLAEATPDARVLVIDWDLASPGLHEIFSDTPGSQSGRSHRSGGKPDSQPGLIELLYDAVASLPLKPDDRQALPEKVFGQLELESYVLEVSGSKAGAHCGLSLLKAGRMDEDFASRVGRFNWDLLEKRAPWFFEELVERLGKSFDYVLVDAATGLSLPSTICTSVLPETLVVVFAPNAQALAEDVEVVRAAVSAREESKDGRPLHVFPVPTRLDGNSPELVERWRRGDEDFAGYQASFEQLFQELHGLDSCDLECYFDAVGIPNAPSVALGRRLGVVTKEQEGASQLARSFDRLARCLRRFQTPWAFKDPTSPPDYPRARNDAAEGTAEEEGAPAAQDGAEAPEVVYEIVSLKEEPEGKLPEPEKQDPKGSGSDKKATADDEQKGKPAVRRAPAADDASEKRHEAADPKGEAPAGTTLKTVLFVIGAAVVVAGLGWIASQHVESEQRVTTAAEAGAARDGDASSGHRLDARGLAGDAAQAGDGDGSELAACDAGRVRHSDSNGHCCFPGQVWSEEVGACIGDRCPAGMLEEGDGCVCPAGQVTTMGSRCCWPGQVWSRGQARCVGEIDCPSGSIEHAQRCVEVGAAGTWAAISPGRFQMGSPTTEVGRTRDEVPHEVILSHGFLIMTTEVEQARYEELMGSNPSRRSDCGNCPVESVTWHEATSYANQLSDAAGVEQCYECTPRGDTVQCALRDSFTQPYDCRGFRLPTEAEWEYAARAGRPEATGRGELDAGHQRCEAENSALDEIAWFCGNTRETHPVGELAQNPWGLHDMLGNVTEWCNDSRGSYPSSTVTDPWTTGGGMRTCRGGSWGSLARETRFARRYAWGQRERSEYIGFRVVRTIHP